MLNDYAQSVSLVVKQDFLFSCFDCLSISPENIKINKKLKNNYKKLRRQNNII